MAQPANDTIDMSKVQFFSYSFHFLFAAAKGCLLPFVAIYLRSLGLTASQIGIILAVGAWVSMFSATCWTSCATSCNKRRLLLISSTFTLIISYIALMMIPPINDQAALEYCNTTTQLSPESHHATTVMINTTTSQALQTNFSSTTQQQPTSFQAEKNDKSPAEDVAFTTKQTTRTKTTTPTTTTTTTTTTTPATTSRSIVHHKELIEETTAHSENEPISEGTKESENEDVINSLSQEDLDLLQQVGITADELRQLNNNEIQELIDGIVENFKGDNNSEKTTTKKGKSSQHHRKQRDTEENMPDSNANEKQGQTEDAKDDIKMPSSEEAGDGASDTLLNNMWAKINQLQEELKQLRNQVFAAVMVIVIVAALFGFPADKMSDDMWFDFLDSSDMLEKYGQHRSWAALGLLIFPIITTAIVVHVPCLIFGAMLKTKIHFLMFASLMFCCFCLAFVYPVYNDVRKVQRKTRLSRGFRILFSDCHSVMYTLTIIIVGMLDALLYNFLFWQIQDIGGSQLVMGTSITVSALSQIIMYIIHKWLIRKITSTGAIMLGLLVLGARLLLYSFLSMSWLVLIGEIFHGMSITLIWSAVIKYPGFRLNPFVMDRSALTVITALSTGFGLASGSVLSGYMLDMFGLRRVFQGGSALAVFWALVFGCSIKCVAKKPKIRYAKLLQDDNSDSEDDSESLDENDWLEIALKHQK